MIFDSNAHPTLNGRWIGGSTADCGFEAVAQQLREAGFQRACAVGLPDVGGYDAASYARRAAEDHFWVPVAAWQPAAGASTESEIERLVGLGYRAVKVHPRLARQPVTSQDLGRLFAAACLWDVAVFLCTYPFGRAGEGHPTDLLAVIAGALEKEPAVRLLLVHAGCVEFLRYVEFARANPNVLLDLSFTLCKYAGSSLDLDLRFALATFDKRICLGTDFPEFGAGAVRERFESLCNGLVLDKRENIGWRNLSTFLQVPTTHDLQRP